MGGQDRCGQGTDLDTHGGEDGDHHSERSPAEAGQIMNGGNALYWIFHRAYIRFLSLLFKAKSIPVQGNRIWIYMYQKAI